MENVFEIRGLSSWFGDHQVLKNLRMDIARNSVTSVMGPSGCGKSTFIRCLNRMHDLTPGFRMEGPRPRRRCPRRPCRSPSRTAPGDRSGR